MTEDPIKRLNKQPRGKILESLIKSGVDDPETTTEKRERFLALLSSRYGYTNEKAVDELERLLRQFNTINRSLIFHRTRLNRKPSTTE